MRLDDSTSLSLLFHLNSEPWLNDEAYKSGAPVQESRVPKRALGYVPLPQVAASPLTELNRGRCSTRVFRREQLPLEAVTALLAAAYGISSIDRSGAEGMPVRRSIPSAGGLYPLEIHAFLRRIDGLDDGVYHYDVTGHGLRRMSSGDPFPSLEHVFYTYPFMIDANGVLAMTAVFSRMQKKYGPRGYRYILLEAGHCGQNVCLRAVELGFATLCMGGFVDSSLNAVLELDPTKEGVVYAVAFGRAQEAGDASSSPAEEAGR
jgi:SagB-type dehydrogenase family enzyme